jgi:hypothetical protein
VTTRHGPVLCAESRLKWMQVRMITATMLHTGVAQYKEFQRKLTHRTKHVKILESILEANGAKVLSDRAGASEFGCLYGSLLQVASHTGVVLVPRKDLPDIPVDKVRTRNVRAWVECEYQQVPRCGVSALTHPADSHASHEGKGHAGSRIVTPYRNKTCTWTHSARQAATVQL